MNTNAIPRSEHPRPQMVREAWLNLNGEWQFEIDQSMSGKERGYASSSTSLSGKILVPFCPESKLSGVEHKDFISSVWYKREFALPEKWTGNRILLHFGAVDYKTEVWVNGKSVGTHKGGYNSFLFDITDALAGTMNIITVYAEDDVRSRQQPRGKQSAQFYSSGCDYTRTTGIWQTVWLECVPKTYIKSFKIIADPENECIHLEALISGNSKGIGLTAVASINGAAVGSKQIRLSGSQAHLTLPLSTVQLWGPGVPNLYDLQLTLDHATGTVDLIDSYFGLRSIQIDGMAVRINGKSIFQRLVLDQGFYPDGIYTAPTDEDLRKDIEISMGLGFNGARLHEKIFEPRFLYWADRLGYLVWGEHANWGLDISTAKGLEHFLPEWLEAVERDYNHPAIIGWCPFNETWDYEGTRQNNEVLRIVYKATKQVDVTRPVIDTSGGFHVETDIYDMHDYEQNPEILKAHYKEMINGVAPYEGFPERQKYEGQPFMVSEYGGIWWNPNHIGEKGWGYGNNPISEEDFLNRYEGLTHALLDNPMLFGFCYTQLYDVEQEVNGLYTYSRKAKFEPALINRINSKKAAIED